MEEANTSMPSNGSILRAPHLREIESTNRGENEFVLSPFTEALVDLRAFGYRSHVIGGRDGNNEALAELIITNNLADKLAELMLDSEFIVSIGQKLFPRFESSRVEKDKVQFTSPMITKAIKTELQKRDLSHVELITLSNVYTEILSQALGPMGIILPFKGVVTITKHDTAIPNYAMIKEAYEISQLVQVFDFIKFDPGLSRVKTINTAAILNALTPILARAGREIKKRTSYHPAFTDTMSLLASFLTQAADLPKQFINSPDLAMLSSNMTIVLAALEQGPTTRVEVEIGEMRNNIASVALALREIPRFKTISMSQLQQHYSHSVLYDLTGMKIEGVVVSRNIALDPRVQVSEFVSVGNSALQTWEQVPYRPAEAQLEALTSSLLPAKLNMADVLNRYLSVASYTTDGHQLVHKLGGVTELELLHYGATFAQNITLTDEPFMINGELVLPSHSLIYILEASEVNYDTLSTIIGDQVNVSDPAECLIMSGIRRQHGTELYSARAQGIPEPDREKVLGTHFNEFAIPLDRSVDLTLKIGEQSITTEVSIQKALGLNPNLSLQVTIPVSSVIVMNSAIEAVLDIAENRSDLLHDEVAGIRASLAINEVLRPIYESRSCRQLAFAIGRSFYGAIPAKDRDFIQKLRGHLNHAEVNYQLLVWAACLTLIRAGLMEFDTLGRITRLFDETKFSTYMIGSEAVSAYDNLVKEV